MFSVLILTLLAAACRDGQHPVSTVNSAANSVDQWLGKWNGPEGTYLLLEKSGQTYRVTISDLDGPKTFQGVADGQSIRFTRDGKVESIHAGSGKDTGMKWLLDKQNCLVIKNGEGFCRD